LGINRKETKHWFGNEKKVMGKAPAEGIAGTLKIN
jgi:hypothetical protein